MQATVTPDVLGKVSQEFDYRIKVRPIPHGAHIEWM